MSAILETDGALGADGIRRYHTTCKVVLHSHVNGTHVISQDITSMANEKNVKGVGTATINLLASKNYFNIIHPNDYINIYMDVGDGEGWTRLFFGFVDQIREQYKVSESGEPSTTYTVRCSDFQKAFERIQIYFNAWMVTRDDFSNQFGVVNIGGVALMTSGITASGSPADIIRNVITLMFGFGSQFQLPPDYGAETAVVNKNREDRKNFLKGELGHIARSALLGLGSFEALQQALDEEVGTVADVISGMSSTDALNVLANKHQVPADKLAKLDTSDATSIIELISDGYYKKRLGSESKSHNETDPAILQAIGAIGLNNYSLLDVIDYFSLYESDSIDGWTVDTGIWESQGPLGGILKSVAHEEINEFFFDLRAADSFADSDNIVFARTPDEIGGNLGHGAKADGICYIPHIIFREYPFGTINEIDGSEMHLSLPEAPGTTAEAITDTFQVGALFSDGPNIPGRHTIAVPSLSLKQNVLFGPKATARHLDVAVVSAQEIVSTDLSRSDSDHFNLFEVYSADFHLADIKYMMSDVLPITTPIHIMRHGLRLKKYTTKYARFNIDIIEAVDGTNTGRESFFFRNVAQVPPRGFVAGDIDPNLVTVVPEEPPSSDGSDGSELPAVAADIQAPVAETGGNTGKVNSAYGYRLKVDSNGDGNFNKVISNQSPTTASNEGAAYVFHNGVDISGPVGTPVFATMDGTVVASVPNGVFGGYGTTVIIKHNIQGFSDPIYSLYAHLDSRSVGLSNPDTNIGRAGRVTGMSSDLVSNGIFPAEPIKKGDQVGTIGKTNGSVGSPTTGRFGPHLHMEYIVRFKGRVYPSQNKGGPAISLGAAATAGSTPDVLVPQGTPVAQIVTPPHDNERSLNPQSIHSTLGLPLTTVAGVVPEDEQIDDAEGFMDGDDLEVTTSGNPTAGVGDAINSAQELLSKNSDGTNKAVDTTTTRKQMLRWGLLQDHWYQHNLEYLSGQIVMRGAPEIRCGYRLDLLERRLSFYVDGVAHSWAPHEKMSTTLTVSRGQSNNPHPLYVMPPVPAYNPKEQRSAVHSRLGYFQLISDPIAVQHALVFRDGPNGQTVTSPDFRANSPMMDGSPVNFVDVPQSSPSPATEPGKPIHDTQYGDFVMEAETTDSRAGLTEESVAELAFTLAEIDEIDQNTSTDNVTGLDLDGPRKP